MHIDYQFTI